MYRLTASESFIEFAIEQKALMFGEFELKSGRLSPYFFNSSGLNTGEASLQLAKAYVSKILDYFGDDLPDYIYGPAYKGIPLCVMIVSRLYQVTNKNVRYVFNRKEEKYHGDGGVLVGLAKGQKDFDGAKVLIVDDVITSGKSSNEAIETIDYFGGEASGIIIGFDRQEIGIDTNESAIQVFKKKHGIPVLSSANLQGLISLLQKKGNDDSTLAKLLSYQKIYGSM